MPCCVEWNGIRASFSSLGNLEQPSWNSGTLINAIFLHGARGTSTVPPRARTTSATNWLKPPPSLDKRRRTTQVGKIVVRCCGAPFGIAELDAKAELPEKGRHVLSIDIVNRIIAVPSIDGAGPVRGVTDENRRQAWFGTGSSQRFQCGPQSLVVFSGKGIMVRRLPTIGMVVPTIRQRRVGTTALTPVGGVGCWAHRPSPNRKCTTTTVESGTILLVLVVVSSVSSSL